MSGLRSLDVKCGDTYVLYDSADSDAVPHLHIVIAGPNQNGTFVLASVTTRRAKSDTMVCLEPGCHRFIDRPSVVTFAYSKLITEQKIDEMVISGDARINDPVSEEILRRLQRGMWDTDRAPREVKQIFVDCAPKE